jgi:TonB family protein
MENLILIYLVKTSVALALFFGLYLLLCRQDTFLVAKRFYLLASLLFSASIPFITVHFSADEKPNIPTSWLSEVVVVPFSSQTHEKAQLFDWQNMLVAVTFLVSLVLLIRFGLQLFEVFRLKYRHLSRKANGYTVVSISDGKVSPFSFFKWVFAGANAWEQDAGNEILQHELVHVTQWHSVDVMLSELFCIVFWWNPVVWLYRREIRINHEYLADRGVLQTGYNPQQYQYLLLQTLTITNRIPINNHFNISQLKQRIAMMNKKKSPWLSATKYLLVMPLAGLLIAGNAVKASQIKILNEIAENTAIGKSIQNAQDQDEKIQTKNDLEQAETASSDESKTSGNQEKNASLDEQQKETKKTKAFVGVEQMPQFPGGEMALMDYLSKNIRYPETAAKNGIQGRVTVRFIVDETGAVTDVVVIKGLNPSCDQEAMRVVKAMPKWIPGKQKGEAVPVYYTLPISYRLKGPEKPKLESQNLLIIVDGQEISQEEFKKIDPATIQSVNILKSKSATEVYGEKVKNKDGVIVIRLKKDN